MYNIQPYLGQWFLELNHLKPYTLFHFYLKYNLFQSNILQSQKVYLYYANYFHYLFRQSFPDLRTYIQHMYYHCYNY